MIYNSILKNGYSSFSLEILEYCDRDQAISREQYFLDLLNPEYNILKKAGSRLGSKHSLEAIAKMRGKALTPKRLAAFNARLARLHANPEFQAKILEHLKRLNSSQKHKEHLKGLHQNPEIQAKRLTGLKVYNLSPPLS
jgi:group I intron endonuclease